MKYPNGYLTMSDAANVGACNEGIISFATHMLSSGELVTRRTMSVPVALKQAGTSWYWDYVVMAILHKYKLTRKFVDHVLGLAEDIASPAIYSFMQIDRNLIHHPSDAVTMAYKLGEDKRVDLNKWLIAAVRAEVQAAKGEKDA